MDLDAGQCICGAQLVGPPVLEPRSPQPVLGGAVWTVLLALVSVAAFWAKPLVLIAVVASLLGARTVRRARRDAAHYGGLRAASAGMMLAMAVTLVVSGILIARIPRAIANYREAGLAETRAEMYRTAGLVARYRETYGRYPDKLSDLTKIEGIGAAPDSHDSWDQRIVYAGYTTGIASTSGVPALNANFELRSPGPDGVQNTADDIVMRDGTIVDATRAVMSPAPPARVTAPVTKRRS
jgi:hypothetical protein